MKQEHLVDEDIDPVYFYYKEIQSDGLNSWTLESTERVRNIYDVIEGLDRQTSVHTLEELEIDENPQMFVDKLLDAYPDHDDAFCTSLINDFSDSMNTRAREPGKYAVLILYDDSLALCHTDSEEMTITKDAEVLERLLDSDNVDKYARFRQINSGIEVLQFERSVSKSFSEFLGLNPEEIAYEEAGDIKIFTEIDDSTVRFEFGRKEFEQKFIFNENYDLFTEILETPNDQYRINHIKMGRRLYNTVDEFLQQFYALYYDLNTLKNQYSTLAESMTPHTTKVVDHEDKVTTGGPNGPTKLVKGSDSKFKIIFADKNIVLSAGWRLQLSKKLRSGETVRLHHVGNDFVEEPLQIGSFEVYNPLDIDEESLNKLYRVTQEARTGEHLSNIIYSVMFHTLSEWSPSPISHFFDQMTKRFEDELSAEGMILRDEDGLMELKSRDWLASIDNDEEAAEKISEELQSDSKLLLIGVDEEEQRIRPLSRSRWDSERNKRISDSLQEMNGNHDSIQLSSLQMGGGNCLLFVYSVRGNQTFDLDMVGP
ncbi:hypothetical protein RH831_11200 [Halodesulfurarchaeum sp. HSR-GB]|uniref:hypothetical protein n=1 Tax=Halodesulfurarchaeum sp. HSR-GB TaxID=3074077 RepID=UPI0028632154|nr:hypothetical protein [Halodesulfurarchaeum sp. HSR-GB]MDR5657741.1 hypothetical protein [Halodesulfurarchaeum sp. HSR-GB]